MYHSKTSKVAKQKLRSFCRDESQTGILFPLSSFPKRNHQLAYSSHKNQKFYPPIIATLPWSLCHLTCSGPPYEKFMDPPQES